MGWGASAARSSSRTSASRTVRPEPAIPKISKDFCIGDSAAYRPDALSENLAPTAFADCESLVTVRQPTALADCESVARRLDGFGSAITAYAIISFSQGADGEFHSMPKPLLADCDTSPEPPRPQPGNRLGGKIGQAGDEPFVLSHGGNSIATRSASEEREHFGRNGAGERRLLVRREPG